MATYPIDVVIKTGEAVSGGKVVEDSLKKVDEAAKRTESAVKNYNSQINSSKNASESAARTTANFIANLERQVATYGKSAGAVARYDASLVGVTRSQQAHINKLLDQVDAQEKSNSKLSQFISIAKAAAAALATIKLAGLIKDSALLSQRFNELGLALGVVGKNVNVSRAAMAQTEQSLQKLGISMIESRQTILKLASANIDLENATKLADLARNAAIVGQLNTSEALDRIVTGVTNASLVTLRSVGIVTTFDAAYAKLAGTLGKNVTDLTDNEKQQARLNAALDKAPALLGLYEESMLNAGKQLRSTDRLVENLKVKIGGLFDSSALLAVSSYTLLLKELDTLVSSLVSSGDLARYGDNIARSFAVAGDAISIVFNALRTINDLAVTSLATLAAVGRFDLDAAGKISQGFIDRTNASIDSIGFLNKALTEQISTRDKLAKTEKDAEAGAFGISAITDFQAKATDRLVAAEEKRIGTEKALADINDKLVNKSAKAALKATEDYIKAQVDFVNGLTKQQTELGKTTFEILKMDAAMLGLGDNTFNQIDALEKSTKTLDEYNKEIARAAEITKSVVTPQETYNQALGELDDLLQKGRITTITYGKALDAAQKTLKGTAVVAKNAFGDMDQYAIGAARNIQSAFANYLFDPFEGGLKGMLKSFLNILRRMVAEIAASGILRGFASLTSGGSFISGATSALGAFGSASGLSLFGGAASAAGSVGTGASITSLIPTAIKTGIESALERSLFSHFATSAVGESLGLSTANAAGSVVAGNISAGSVASGQAAAAAATTTELGASIASGISTAGITIAASIIASMVTNKELFGQSAGVVAGGASALGGLAAGAALGSEAGPIGAAIGAIVGLVSVLGFGHGPEKQRETVFRGSLSAQGLEDGEFDTRFRRKGGWFVSNKNRHEIQAASDQVNEQFARTMAGIASSVGVLSENLGLETKRILDFSKPFSVTSANGQPVSAEQINDLLAPIASEISQFLLPEIKSLQRGDEDAFQALTRLSSEFSTLVVAGTVLNQTLAQSRETILKMTFAERERFIALSGGIEVLKSDIEFFSNNFLTEGERLKVAQEGIIQNMSALGLNADITKDQFKALVQSFGKLGGITESQLHGLFALQRTWVEVRDATDAYNKTLGTTIEAERTLVDIKNDLSDAYSRERSELVSTINKFDSFSKSIGDFRKSLLLGDLSTLDPLGRLNEARTQFNRVRALAAQGDESSIAKLPDVSKAFLEASKEYNATSAAFASDFEFVQEVLSSVETSTQTQADLVRVQLSKLDASVSGLIAIDNSVKTVAELLRELIAVTRTTNDVTTLPLVGRGGTISTGGGIPIPRVSTPANVRGGLASSVGTLAGGVGRGAVSSFASTAASIQAAQGRTFESALATYNAAVGSGLSLNVAAKTAGYTQADVSKFLADTGLKSFDVGVNSLPRDMVIQAHAGEEIRPFKQVQADAENQKQVVVELKALVRLQASANAALIAELRSVKKSSEESARVQRRGTGT